MDVVSHTFWAGAGAKYINLKTDRKLNVWFAGFFGVFPDLFAFTIPFSITIWMLVSGQAAFEEIPWHKSPQENATLGTESKFHYLIPLSQALYNYSHSAVVFLAVFAIACLIFKRPVWELCGWLLHIILDLPTHTAEFFPTPVFWPVSGWKFTQGFSWGEPWFMFANCAAIILFSLYLWRKNRLQNKKNALEN